MISYGIIGKKGSGKSYLSKYLRENANLTKEESMKYVNVENIKMAEPLKIMVSNVLYSIGYNHKTVERMIEGDLKEVVIDELGVTPRHMMQTIGTEWGRDCVNEGLWGKCFTYKCEQLQATGNYVICDDVRFDNECLTAVNNDLTLIAIITPDIDTKDKHRSEVPPDNLYTEVIWLNDKKTPLTMNLNELQARIEQRSAFTTTRVVIYNNEIYNVALPSDLEWTYDNIINCIEEQEQLHLQLLEEGHAYD